ncbi:Putative protein of unknown function [Podospora comata]|uniref:Uncharacterized protein n=1 Tax=Podospora comata TaxID=48703 RepID=A0ABY6RTX9_PODCO|nr:Putative protein of unknown function [Podospora comata]
MLLLISMNYRPSYGCSFCTQREPAGVKEAAPAATAAMSGPGIGGGFPKRDSGCVGAGQESVLSGRPAGSPISLP